MVEPLADSFNKLFHNCQPFHDHCTLIQAAGATEVKLAQFFIDVSPGREWSSTINRAMLEIGNVKEPTNMSVLVPTVTMTQLAAYGPFDFISIDAEWEDFNLVQSAPSTMLDACQLLCIEPCSLEDRANMKRWFSEHGFKPVYETPENLLVAH